MTEIDNWERFFDHWEKESDAIRETMLSPPDCGSIRRSFNGDYLFLMATNQRSDLASEIIPKLELLESKLTTSLAIARTKYLDKHPPLSEKFVEAIGNALGKIQKK